MASNIQSQSHQHRGWACPALMAGGPRRNLGVHAENGVSSPQIFHFNQWGHVPLPAGSLKTIDTQLGAAGAVARVGAGP